jgi:hypothetical protein
MALATVVTLTAYKRNLGWWPSTPIVSAFLGIEGQLAVVSAIAVFFSSITNATLASMFTLALAIAGQFSREVFYFYRSKGTVRALAYVIPNLGALDYKLEVVYQQPVAAGRLALPLLYAALYVGCVLALAAAAFARRDFR